MLIKLLTGDALTQLKTLDDESVDMTITSPPYYGLRDYGVEGQLGMEPTVEEYITHLGKIFSEVYRVLKPTGACWINIGDTYAGNGIYIGKYKETHPDHKDLHTGHSDKYPQKVKGYRDEHTRFKSQLCVPERLVIEMMSRGYIKRNTVIWKKPSCLPSSAKDRFTVDFEYLFFFVKNEKYYFKQQFEPYSEVYLKDKRHEMDEIPTYSTKYPDGIGAIDGGTRTRNNIFESGLKEEGRNKRAVWSINPARCAEAHFATFPQELIETPIRACCPEGGTVMDIFLGRGTTGILAKKLGLNFIGIELNPEYMEMARRNIFPDQTDLFLEGEAKP